MRRRTECSQQLELPFPLPLGGDCFDCFRKAVVYKRVEGQLTGVCVWHADKFRPVKARPRLVELKKVGAA